MLFLETTKEDDFRRLQGRLYRVGCGVDRWKGSVAISFVVLEPVA